MIPRTMLSVTHLIESAKVHQVISSLNFDYNKNNYKRADLGSIVKSEYNKPWKRFLETDLV